MSEISNKAGSTDPDGQADCSGSKELAGADEHTNATSEELTEKSLQGAPGEGGVSGKEMDGENGKGASLEYGDQDALAFYAAGLDWPNGLARLFNELISSFKNKKKK